jgi:hypothetical protein
MIPVLAKLPELGITERPGTNFALMSARISKTPSFPNAMFAKPWPTPPTANPRSNILSATKPASRPACSLPITGPTNQT